MKKTISVFFFIILASILISCGEYIAERETIIGKWSRQINVSGTTDAVQYYEFKEDGSLVYFYSGLDESKEGTWKIDNPGKIEITIDRTDIFDFNIREDKLTIGEQVFTKE